MHNKLKDQFSQTRAGDLGIFGDPVEHSLSPIMQHAAIKTWKQVFEDRNEAVPTYHKFHVRSEDLEEAFFLLKKYRLRGVNITIPHKVSACNHVDKLDAFAQKVGAINTVVFDNGKLEGHNTDGFGFQRSLETDLGMEVEGKKVALLGAGGTGRVLAFQLQEAKAEKIYWWNRNFEKLQSFYRERSSSLPAVEIVRDEIKMADLIPEVNLVVNATAIGLKEGESLPIKNVNFSPGQHVFDVVYNRPTEFLAKAENQGAFGCGGLGMLVHQGAQSFRLWLGKPAPAEVMRSALLEAIKKV